MNILEFYRKENLKSKAPTSAFFVGKNRRCNFKDLKTPHDVCGDLLSRQTLILCGIKTDALLKRGISTGRKNCNI